jgi:hypothetical protein
MQLFTRVLAAAIAAAPFFAQAAPLSLRQSDDKIPGKYIIRLKPDTDVASIAAHHNKVRNIHARNLARRNGGEGTLGKEREYSFGGFKGYAGSFDAATVEELRALDEVLDVEEDFMMYTVQSNLKATVQINWNATKLDITTTSSQLITRKPANLFTHAQD